MTREEFEEKLREFNSGKKRARKFFIFGFIVVVISPIIFTQTIPFLGVNFTNTGNIGDTIGGLTAPIIGLLSAYLLYYALYAQIEANTIVWTQFSNEAIIKSEAEKEKQIEILYSSLEKSISNFKYTVYHKLESKDSFGSNAFEQLWIDVDYKYGISSDIYHYIREVNSLMTLMLQIIQMLEGKESNPYFLLLKHQFQFVILQQLNFKTDAEISDWKTTIDKTVPKLFDTAELILKLRKKFKLIV